MTTQPNSNVTQLPAKPKAPKAPKAPKPQARRRAQVRPAKSATEALLTEPMVERPIILESSAAHNQVERLLYETDASMMMLRTQINALEERFADLDKIHRGCVAFLGQTGAAGTAE